MVPEPGRVERTLHRVIADQARACPDKDGRGTNRDFIGSALLWPDVLSGDVAI